MKTTIIIFSGYNQRAVIAFIRTLEKNSIEYSIIAKSKEDPIFHTTYKDKVLIVRKDLSINRELFINIKNRLTENVENQNLFIAPSTEHLNRFIVHNVSFLNELNFTVPLVEQDLYANVSDKLSFSETCRSHNIKTPKEIQSPSENDIPLVAKPRQYESSDGSNHHPVLILTKSQLSHFLKTKVQSDFYFQEFIQGESYYLLYYISKNGEIRKTSQKNLIQQPDGKSIIAAVSSNIHLDKISTLYENMLVELKYRGLIMIEIIKQEDDFFMIEANPRFWGPSQLFIDAKENLFEALLEDYEISNNPSSNCNKATSAKYFWYGGMNAIMHTNQPLKHYYFKEDEFLTNELSNWLKHDIYKRKDTINLFKNEIKWNNK